MSKKDTYRNLHQKELSSLIESFRLGNKDAFSALYQKYFNKFLQYGMLIHPDQKEVEDIVQEFFLWIYKHPRHLDKVQRFDLYAFSSIKQNIYSFLSKKNRSKASLHRFLDQTDLFENDLPLESAWIKQEFTDYQKLFLNEEINKLPNHLKEILFLRYYEGLNYDEISIVLEVSNQIARNYVSRAIKRIRRSIPQLAYSLKFLASLCLIQGF